jgi:hypothetical protein
MTNILHYRSRKLLQHRRRFWKDTVLCPLWFNDQEVLEAELLSICLNTTNPRRLLGTENLPILGNQVSYIITKVHSSKLFLMTLMKVMDTATKSLVSRFFSSFLYGPFPSFPSQENTVKLLFCCFANIDLEPRNRKLAPLEPEGYKEVHHLPSFRLLYVSWIQVFIDDTSVIFFHLSCDIQY